MKLKRVLVIYKKSSFELYGKVRKDRRFLKLLKKPNSAALHLRKNHSTHSETMYRVREILKEMKIPAHFRYRAQRFSEKAYSLVLTVGGDGTFLEASHSISKVPILGLNSNPADSVGMLCGITIRDLRKTLERIESGTMPFREFVRLRIQLGKKKISTPVLNDILVAHKNPASMSRYVIGMRGRKEEQKSSGIWVAAPIGTTAGIRSAGGRVMSLREKGYQFRVREPYRAPGKSIKILGSVMRSREILTVTSRMRAGKIFLDGPHEFYDFPIGECVRISTQAPKLKVFGFDERRRKKVK